MATVSNLLSKFESDPFFGRHTELALMETALSNQDWRMVHLHGPGGIGKTALIKQYCRDHQVEAFCLHLTGNNRTSDRTHPQYTVNVQYPYKQSGTIESSFPPSQTVSIDHLSGFIGRIASGLPMAILIMDPLEKWAPLYEWLETSFFPSLPVNVRVITASRFPLDDPWSSEEIWRQVVHSIELKPLDQTTSFRYIESFGITDFETCHKISKFIRGFPFALRQLCRDIINAGNDIMASQLYQTQFYSRATQYLLKHIHLNNAQYKILDAASLLWSFDYDLITHLLQYEVTIRSFRQFCDLPIVNLTSTGWQINNSVRYWFRKEFSFRSPELHSTYQNKARSYLLRKIHQIHPFDRSELYLQMLHLIDKDVLHTYCFLESFDQFDVKPLPKQDLPAVRQMFVTFHRNVPGFFPDLTLQESYLEKYWELSPDTFYGFYKGGRLVLFISSLPLTETIRRELSKNPTYSNYINHSNLQENETVMWIASFLPEFGASAIGLAFMYGYSRLAPHRLMTVITPFPEAHQLMESMGFQRLLWADYVSEEGVVYKAYQLDLRVQMLSDRFLSSYSTAQLTSKLSRSEMVEHTKNLLVNFHHFEEKEAIVNKCPLMSKYAGSKNDLTGVADSIRKFILSVLEEWSNSTETNVMYGNLMRMNYIQKSRNHETIALRLNMPLSTYYRNLKKGTIKMSEALSGFIIQQTK